MRIPFCALEYVFDSQSPFNRTRYDLLPHRLSRLLHYRYGMSKDGRRSHVFLIGKDEFSTRIASNYQLWKTRNFTINSVRNGIKLNANAVLRYVHQFYCVFDLKYVLKMIYIKCFVVKGRESCWYGKSKQWRRLFRWSTKLLYCIVMLKWHERLQYSAEIVKSYTIYLPNAMEEIKTLSGNFVDLASPCIACDWLWPCKI